MRKNNLKQKNIHFLEVKKIQETIRQNKKLSFSLRNAAASNTLRNGAYKKHAYQIDLSSFDGILEFNPIEKWIVVEPRITFLSLCKYTLMHNLIPPVVPEFTSITVGGAIMGAALESSSHRFGQFNDCCLEYNLILGNAELVKASPKENPDLFYAVAGSYGSLGILTSVKLKLIEAKKWVKLNYCWFQDVEESVKVLTSPQSADFVEGIAYSTKSCVVITGEMTDTITSNKIYSQKRPWSTWYAQHVHKTRNQEEWMSLEEYLFRLDRGGFWIGRYINSFWTMTSLLLHLGIPKIKHCSINPNFLFRLLFGWTFSSKKLYGFWHKIPNSISEKLFFIHDFYAPFSKAQEILEHLMAKTGIFPIWLCPIKGTQTPQFLSPHFGNTDFLNIGLYGIPQNNDMPIPQLSAQLEKDIINFGGKKMLYSFTYYDQQNFSKIYSCELYNHLRKKYFAENAFPSLYTKVKASGGN